MYRDTRRENRMPERTFSKQALIFVLSDFLFSPSPCARNERIVQWRLILAAKTMAVGVSFSVRMGFVDFEPFTRPCFSHFLNYIIM